jgi:hypothetical protein
MSSLTSTTSSGGDHDFDRSKLVFANFTTHRPPKYPHFNELTSTFDENLLNPVIGELRRYIKIGFIEKRPFFTTSMQALAQTMWRVTPCCGDDGKIMFQEARLKATYEYVKVLFTNFVKSEVTPSCSNGGGVDILKQSSHCWEVMDLFDKVTGIFFKELIYFYKCTFTHPDVFELHDLGTNIRREYFFNILKDRLQSYIVDLINLLRVDDWQRYGKTTDLYFDDERYSYLQNIKNLFIRIDEKENAAGNSKIAYIECIEIPFLDKLSEFYTLKVNAWKSYDVTSVKEDEDTYLKFCIAALKLERARARRFLDASTFQKVDQTLITLFVSSNMSNLEANFPTIFDGLFSCDRFLSSGDGLASSFVMDSARNAFDILSEYDKFVSSTMCCTKIGEVMSSTIIKNFSMLLDRSTSGPPEKSPEKQNEKIFIFFINFFKTFDCYQHILTTSIFNNNVLVSSKGKDAYRNVINPEAGRNNTACFGRSFAETIALFLDCILGKFKPPPITVKTEITASAAESANFDEYLDKSIVICQFIEDKMTLFQSLQNFLFYRITECKSEDLDLDKERDFIGKLTNQFGLSLTVKLKGLINSVSESQVFRANIVESSAKSEDKADNEISVYPLVLHKDYFGRQRPIQIIKCPCLLPFDTAFQKVKAAYSKVFPSQTLDVSYSTGVCLLSCSFPQREALSLATPLISADFSDGSPSPNVSPTSPTSPTSPRAGYPSGLNAVSTQGSSLGSSNKSRTYKVFTGVLQALILTAFNTSISGQLADANGYITYSHIKELTGLGDSEISRILIPLYRGNLKLLTAQLSTGVDDKTGRFQPSCKFKANPEFFTKNVKFSINLLRYEVSEKAVSTSISNQLNELIDYAVVRIMKARKSLSSRELILEVQKQAADRNSQLKDRDIVKRFDSLIDREFIKRDEGSPDVFLYTS